MKKEFCTYTQSIAIKELGFDEKRLGHYLNINKLFFLGELDDDYIEGITSAPLIQQAFRFFRDKYGLHYCILYNEDKLEYDAGVFGELVKPFWDDEKVFKTYKEAEQACLDKLIEIAKEK